MATLENSPLTKQKLLDLQATVDAWHAAQKKKVVRNVALLRTMQTPLEKNATAVDDIAKNALSLLKSIREDGSAN